MWPAPLVTSTMQFAMESISTWRERVLNPWRFNKIVYSDVELDNEVDNIFRCAWVRGQEALGAGAVQHA